MITVRFGSVRVLSIFKITVDDGGLSRALRVLRVLVVTTGTSGISIAAAKSRKA